MNKITLSLIIIILSITFLSCSENTDKENSKNHEMELCQKLWQSYRADLFLGNPFEIGKNFEDDAIVVYPDMPEIIGKENILKALNDMFPKTKILKFDFKIQECLISDSSLFIYISADEKSMRYSIEYSSHVRISSFWKLNSEKVWKISLVHLNYNN
ncbi:MAG: hypothetical protein U0W24_00035 [Bacteroidales bacterium]